jgi:hypothetical protein
MFIIMTTRGQKKRLSRGRIRRLHQDELTHIGAHREAAYGRAQRQQIFESGRGPECDARHCQSPQVNLVQTSDRNFRLWTIACQVVLC